MPSLQARILEWLLPLAGAKRAFTSEEALRRDIASRRRHGPALPPSSMRRRYRIDEKRFRGCRVFTVRPREGDSGRHILYLHGGGYFAPILAAHWWIVRRLVRRLNATATVPFYPLAPEHTAPQLLDAMRGLAGKVIEEAAPANVVFVGDSAGGGIALALAQQLRDRSLPLPAHLVLLSPWLDVTMSDPSQPTLARIDPILDIPGGRAAGRMYAGDLPPTDPRVSPLFGTLRGLPPIAVIAGTRDLLYADARRLAEKARAEGARVELYEHDGLFHVFVAVGLPETRRAMDQIAAFIETPTLGRAA
jgi:acetyl esterase/lipase